jgi:hypothetical protein
MAEEKPIVGHTKHGELTLDQLAELQPGLGQLMPLVSERYWTLYYAAKSGNWPLADYELRGLKSLWQKMGTTRPKYKGMLENYARKIFDPLAQHIASRNLDGFEKTYSRGIELANTMHRASDHPEIVWKLPPGPPQHLQLTVDSGQG